MTSAPAGQITDYKWKIPNMRQHWDTYQKTEAPSDVFALNDKSAEFSLFLRATTDVFQSASFGIVLKKLAGSTPLNAKFKIWFEDNYGNKFGNEYTVDNHWFALVNDNITVCCQIKPNVLQIDGISSGQVKSLHRQRTWSCYEKGIASDITIQVDGQDFKVNSFVLISQSEVFEKMLLTDTQEASTKIIKIGGIEATVMKSFIRWLHLGEIQPEDRVEDLYVVAGRYLIEDLKKQCSFYMTEGVTKENVGKRLAVAAKLDDEKLVEFALDFLSRLKPAEYTFALMSEEWIAYANDDKEAVSKLKDRLCAKMM